MAIIREDYVSFEVAKLLKDKGFDWACIGYYVDDEPDDVKYSSICETNSIWEARCCSAPTIQMAMKWLREIYFLEIYPYHDFPKVGDKWWFEIIKYPNSVSEYESETEYNSSEEACEAAIKYCLENLI